MYVSARPSAGYVLRGPNLDAPPGTRGRCVAATRAAADDGGPCLLAGLPVRSNRPSDRGSQDPLGPVPRPHSGGATLPLLPEEGGPDHRDPSPPPTPALRILGPSVLRAPDAARPPESGRPAPRPG